MRSAVAALLAAAVAAVVAAQDYPQEGDYAQLWTCGTNSRRQSWGIEPSSQPFPMRHVYLQGSYNTSTGYWLVLDVEGWGNSTGSRLHAWENSTSGWQPVNQQWSVNSATGQIVSLMNGMCAEASSALAGMPVTLQHCSSSNPLQSFNYEASTGFFHSSADSTLCLDVGSSVTCLDAPFSGYTYCDPDASIDARVADLIPRLVPADYQALLDNDNPGIPRLGIPRIQFGECLHGPLTGCGAPYTDPTTGYTSTGCPTSFPHALATGSSFNRTLWTQIGQVVSTEDRALHNQGGIAASIFWAPDINPGRPPQWGRICEVTGEDPFLVGEYAFRFSSALQEGEDPRYVKAASTAKHFSAYDMESSDGTWRGAFDALVSDHDLVEYYWPPFRSAVQRAHVQSIMCSYNAVNGIPSCANDFFNNEIVRGQWGFDGFFVSDCGAIDFIFTQHDYTHDYPSTVAAALRGGTDANCGSVYSSWIVPAFQNGTINITDLQTAGARLMRTVFMLGLVDPPERVVYTQYNNTMVDTPEHRQLAFEAAVQSMVLLQNNATKTPWGNGQPLLPLQAGKFRSVAVSGPNANATQTLLSNYHGTNTLVNDQSILAALQRRGAQDGFSVNFNVGCPYISCLDTSGFGAAVSSAASSDLAIVVVGLCTDDCPGGDIDNDAHEGEGHDRTTTDLPGHQEDLIRAIAATGTPLVVVLVHGGILSIDWTKSNVSTILDAHYPGEVGGDAVVATLMGDYSPSGRSTLTWYPSAYQYQRVNVTDMTLAPHGNIPGAPVVATA